MTFKTKLDVELLDNQSNQGRGAWVLCSDLVFQSDIAGMDIIVPAGFQTDFASVPRLPVAFWLTGDCAHAPAVVHDYLYSVGNYPRKVADDILVEAMKATGVPGWRRAAIYWAVRAFGGSHYEARK